MGALLLIVVVVVAVAAVASFIAIAQANAAARQNYLTSVKNENLQLVFAQFKPETNPNTDSWNNVTLNIRNENTANSYLTQIKAGAYWFPHWNQINVQTNQLLTNSSSHRPIVYGVGGPSLLIPAKGTLGVILNFSVNGQVAPLRNSSIAVTLLSGAGNFFTTVFNPPSAQFSQTVTQSAFGSIARDLLQLDGGLSAQGNGTIQSYVWSVQVTPNNWNHIWSTATTFTATGRTFTYRPESLYPSMLATLNESGPIRVTLTVQDSNGFESSTQPTVIPGDPLAAPVQSLKVVSNVEQGGTCCSAVLTMSLTDVYGNPVAGHVVDFEMVSGDIRSITPLFAVTDNTGHGVTTISFGGQGVVVAVSEDNPALKVQVIEGASLSVTVNPPAPTIDSGQSVVLTANPTGGSGIYTSFAWYSGAVCSGAVLSTAGSYSTPVLLAATTYCVLVTDSLGATASAAVTVTVGAALVAGGITPANPTIDGGQSVVLTSHASGGSAPLTYQWFSDGVCTTPIPSATAATYTASPTSSATFSYQVTDSQSVTTCSDVTQPGGDVVTVNSGVVAPAITTDFAATDVGETNTLSTLTSFSGGTSPYSCQWLEEVPGASGFSNLGSPFGCISGSFPTTSTGALSTTGSWSFGLRVTDNTGASVESPPIAVTVNPALTVPKPTPPASQMVDQGQTAMVAGTTPTTGTSPYTYQWLEEAPGASTYTDAVDCVAPTTLTCSFATSTSTVTGTYSFELQVTDAAGVNEIASSPSASVIVNAQLVLPAVSASGSGDSWTITMAGGFTGGTPGYTCQWLVEAPGATGYSALTSPFSCSALTTYGIPVTLTTGTWNFEFQVADSATNQVVEVSNVSVVAT